MKSRREFFARIFVVMFALMFVVCQGPAGPEGREGPAGPKGDQGEPGVSIIWKGELEEAPAAPELYWAYFNKASGNAYIYTSAGWEQLARSGEAGAAGAKGDDGAGGVSISWQGTLPSAPSDAQLNWAYYNSADKKSYIYDGTTWKVLAVDGVAGDDGTDGTHGTNGTHGSNGANGKDVYLVVFNSMGGEPAIDAIGVSNGETVELPAHDLFEKSGYTLVGWYKDKNLTQPYSFSSPVTGNLTLYAKWERDFTDSRDSKTYRMVEIEGQVWMAENLNYAAAGSKCYGEGGQVYDENWQLQTLTPSEVAANCAKYGRLYDWSTAMGGVASSSSNPSGVKGVCPTGWHLPSDAEWTVLTDYVGDPAGTKLKATTGWIWNTLYNVSGNGTDDVEFSALPGGIGYSDGNFSDAGYIGNWWSSTENDAYDARERNMDYSSNYLYRLDSDKTNLFSVRCVRD